MGGDNYIILLLVVAIATYAQTITGFAFGLILMAGAALFHVAPLGMIAILISILSLFNCVVALSRRHVELDLKIIILCAASGLVTVILGVWVLNILSANYVSWLKIILGVAIILSSLSLIWHPKPRQERSPAWTFAILGGVSGLMGGMFSTSGPPLVFHFYRQPISQAMIRDCLLLIFSINSLQRLVIVSYQGAVTWDILFLAGLSIPVVLSFTWLGRRYPPPLEASSLRQIAFMLLAFSGFSLCLAGFG